VLQERAVEAQELLAGTRWDVVQAIAKKPLTGAELARALKTSPANVSQHLKLLELGGIVTKDRARGKASTYRLARTVAYVTVLDTGLHAGARRVAVPLDNARSAELRLFLEGKASSRFIRAFLAQHEDLVRGFSAFGTLPEAEDVPILVIADDVRALRKEYANVQIGPRKIVIWSHTPDEFEEGLKRNEAYFHSMLQNVNVLADHKALFARWREEYL
jgi:DNA-binding transcriptional ArsR family regulator